MRDRRFLRNMVLVTLCLAGCSDGADSGETGTASRSVAGTCVVIQRGLAGDIADTDIASNYPGQNFGTSPLARVGYSGGGERQALFRAELGQIPFRSRIESARLVLRQENTGRAVLRAHEVLAPWHERAVTWSSFGAAFAPEVIAEADNGGRAGAVTLDLTQLVQAWVDGTSENHGVLLAQDTAATHVYTSNANQRPRLEVCYAPPAEPEGTSLFVQVLDAAGTPVPTAAVSVGETLHVTDGAGRLLLENLAPGRVVASVQARGFAPASAVVDVPAGVQAGTEVRLLPLGPPVPFEAEEGAVLEQGAVRVEIPAGGLVDFRGEPVTGTVEATVVPLDPTTASVADFPAPLEATTAETGEPVSLESLAMAEVSLWQDGLPVQLAPGATARLALRLPAAFAGQYEIGETIPAWWLDVEAGVWREEGQGVILPDADEPGALIWVVDVAHFTWWNCDRPWTDKHCYDVTVVDSDGNPLPGVTVGANGVSYSGSSWPSATDDSGQACVDTKRNSLANLLVGPASAPLASYPVTGSGPASDCAGNGAACVPITIEVIPEVICTPGASVPCPYGGPPGTEDVGLCQAGAMTCNSTGTAWSGCVGEVQPVQETCATPFDDDCDGTANEVDDGLDCECGLGDEPVTCYTGPDETENVGTCRTGSRTCILSLGKYGPCEGQVLPALDVCSTPEDEDCDGTAREAWEGDVYADSRDDIEPLRGCSGIDGYLELDINEDTAADLSALDAIEYVTRSVYLYPFVSYDAPVLPSLTTIGRDLNFYAYWAPVYRDPLPALASIGDDLGLYGTDIAFPVLQTIDGSVTLEAATAEFPVLQTIGGAVSLGSATGEFPMLQTIDGSVTLEAATAEFPVLQTIGEYLDIYWPPTGALSGFDSLQSVGDTIVLAYVNADELSGLDSVSSAYGIQIWDSNIGTFNALHGLQSLMYLSIEYSSIGNLGGFQGLPSLNWMEIYYSSIGNLGGFQGLQSLGYLYMYESMVHMEHAFPVLGEIWGNFSSTFSSLHVVDSFPALARINGWLELYGSEDADNGEIIDSFNALDIIGDGLSMHDSGMTRVRGFDSLTTAGAIWIDSNETLSSLEGFGQLAEILWTGISITDNPMLDACYVENLESTVRANGYTGSFEASDNGPDGGACDAPP